MFHCFSRKPPSNGKYLLLTIQDQILNRYSRPGKSAQLECEHHRNIHSETSGSGRQSQEAAAGFSAAHFASSHARNLGAALWIFCLKMHEDLRLEFLFLSRTLCFNVPHQFHLNTGDWHFIFYILVKWIVPVFDFISLTPNLQAEQEKINNPNYVGRKGGFMWVEKVLKWATLLTENKKTVFKKVLFSSLKSIYTYCIKISLYSGQIYFEY